MLSVEEIHDHRLAMAKYRELATKFNNNPYSLSKTEQNELINTIKYLKMEVFTSWSSVSKADELLMRLNLLQVQKASQQNGK